MKRGSIALLLACLVLAFALTACGGNTETSTDAPADTNAEEQTAQTEQTTQADQNTQNETAGLPAEGDIGDYHVVLKDCAFGKDYEGKDMIVINYDFTNNSADTMSALVGIYMQAFQDGVQLDTAMVLDDSVYDAGIAQKDIKPGTTLEGCQNAFVLTSDSPVEIEVSDMFNDPTVGMTYDVQN